MLTFGQRRPGVVGDGRARRDGLEAPELSALAKRRVPGGVDRRVAHLGCKPIGAQDQAAIIDDAPTDAGADGDIEQAPQGVAI